MRVLAFTNSYSYAYILTDNFLFLEIGGSSSQSSSQVSHRSEIPDTGADVSSPNTTANKEADHVVVNNTAARVESLNLL